MGIFRSASISKVMVDQRNTGIASSYDSTLSIWSLDSAKCENLLSGVHAKPVTEFDWKNSLCVSGDRDGLICIWDINKCKCVKSYKGHSGQVSRILLYSDGHDYNFIVSGGASVLVLDCVGRGNVCGGYEKQQASVQRPDSWRIGDDG